jgi:urea transport system permease protein
MSVSTELRVRTRRGFVALLIVLGVCVSLGPVGAEEAYPPPEPAVSGLSAQTADALPRPSDGADGAAGEVAEPPVPEDLATTASRLGDRSFAVKEAAVSAIANSGDPRAAALLKALLAGELQQRREDDRLVLAAAAGAGLRLTDALTGERLGEAAARDLKKIALNNRMRTMLRAAIAGLTLSHPEAEVRLRAAQEMTGVSDPELLGRLRERLAEEEDDRVRAALELSLAMADLADPAPGVRATAIETLSGRLEPEVRNRLRPIAAEDPDPEVREAAAGVLAGIETRLKVFAATETLFFGLSLGSVLVLAAIGLAITFGVMGVINMAHGELIMLGAYTTYLVQLAMPNAIEYSLLVAIPAAFLVSGAVGVAIERSVIRFLYGRPLETLLATFGISLILQQLVRTTISAQNVVVENPSWMSGSLVINPALSLTFNRLYVLIFALLVFAALLLILKRTALGLQVRAVSQNRAMARAMGVRSARVDALTFGLGSGIAGVAGVALSQLTNVGPNMGQAYIIDSFMVVVFGGVGNLWGTLVAGLSLGVANKLMEPWAGAVLAKILVLVFIILFIQKRPRGLFPQRGRAADA